MSPERIGNTNMWHLFEGEVVERRGVEIHGPAVVRVTEFEDVLLVQSGGKKVEVERTDFEKAVKKI